MQRSIGCAAIATAISLLGFTEAKASLPPEWTVQKQAPTGLTTIAGYGPALAAFNNTVYMAWTNSESRNQ